jgi:hypothetical protein
MKSSKASVAAKKSKYSVLTAWKALAALIVLCFTWTVIPSLFSSDPCFNDWDIACTYAPKALQAMDRLSLLIGLLMSVVMFPAFLLITVVLVLRRRSRGGES